MEIKEFKRVNRVVALAVLLLSAITYLMTIEPTASFWDCGEFIASSYKLEVGHPPGNPVFQLFARLFTLFGDAQNAAMLVNAMSALCSAFTIFFLYLTIYNLISQSILSRSTCILTRNSKPYTKYACIKHQHLIPHSSSFLIKSPIVPEAINFAKCSFSSNKLI